MSRYQIGEDEKYNGEGKKEDDKEGRGEKRIVG